MYAKATSEIFTAFKIQVVVFWSAASIFGVKMEAEWSSETLVTYYFTTRRHYTEDQDLNKQSLFMLTYFSH